MKDTLINHRIVLGFLLAIMLFGSTDSLGLKFEIILIISPSVQSEMNNASCLGCDITCKKVLDLLIDFENSYVIRFLRAGSNSLSYLRDLFNKNSATKYFLIVCKKTVKSLLGLDASKRCGYQNLLATEWLVVVT